MSELAGLVPVGSGKVRDLYQVDDDHLLLVASDRISAFDVVLDDPVPGKGEVLTALTVFWLELLADLVPNHLAGWRASELPTGPPPGRPGHAGAASGHGPVRVCGPGLPGRVRLEGLPGHRDRLRHPLRAGLRQADRLPEPIYTPATKAVTGHDENVSEAQVAEALGPDLSGRLRDLTLEIYRRGAEHAARRGILLADTKLEFGLDGGEVVLADEVLTPDSSRFWPAGGWLPGHSPPSFDKQYVRDWLRTSPGTSAPGPGPPARRARRHRRPLPRGLRAAGRPATGRLAGRGQELAPGWPPSAVAPEIAAEVLFEPPLVWSPPAVAAAPASSWRSRPGPGTAASDGADGDGAAISAGCEARCWRRPAAGEQAVAGQPDAPAMPPGLQEHHRQAVLGQRMVGRAAEAVAEDAVAGVLGQLGERPQVPVPDGAQEVGVGGRVHRPACPRRRRGSARYGCSR